MNMAFWRTEIRWLTALAALAAGCSSPPPSASSDAGAPAAAAEPISAAPEAIQTATRIATAHDDIARMLAPNPTGWKVDDDQITSQGWRTASSDSTLGLVARLPHEANGSIEVGLGQAARFRLKMAPDGANPARYALHDGRALYAGAYRSTDAIVVSDAGRLEILLVLKDESAPHDFSWYLDLPSGLRNVTTAPSGEITLNDAKGDPVFRFTRSFAVDDRGARREAAMTLADQRLSVRLDTNGLSFPVLLDPGIETAVWTQMPPTPNPPRAGFGLAWDSGRQLVDLFGGSAGGGACQNDLWQWNGSNWVNQPTGGPPQPRQFPIFSDIGNGRLLLFGGATCTGSPLANNTFILNGNAWSNTGLTGPPARWKSAAAFDTGRGKLVLFGGNTCGGNCPDASTWEYDSALGWTPSTPLTNAPKPRMQHGMTYDPIRKVTLLFGGFGSSGNASAELWQWDGLDWTLLNDGIAPATAPAVLAFDSIRGVTVLYGNTGGRVYEWDSKAWSVFNPPAPKPIAADGMIFDPVRGRTVAVYSPPPNGMETWLYYTRGRDCTAASQCDTGYCVDGVCCEQSACSGTCVACSVAKKGQGLDGLCESIVAGTDPDNECPDQGAASCGKDGWCNGLAGAASGCRGYADGTVCRAAVPGGCDIDETCANGACPIDAHQMAGTVCRGAANECDLTETCDGSASCPADAVKMAGTACSDDGNICTTDTCNGTVGGPACKHQAGNTGTVCRSAVGECDLAETCDGMSVNCPTDSKKPNLTSCTADSNPCTLDQCDGTHDTCQHPAGNAGAVCRPAAGVCDIPETCTGASTACPATDAKYGANHECRPVAPGGCDVAESCDGVNDNCPVDSFLGNSTQCRAPSCSAAVATLQAFCPGNSASCPPVQTQSCAPGQCVGTGCGGCPNGDSDCASNQYCNGGVCAPKKMTSSGCGRKEECISGFCADNYCCNNACNGGICDSCALVGSIGTCSPVAASTVCRAAAGECDVAETCNGQMTCPADAKVGNGTSCTDDGNPCTTDTCNGSSNSCVHAAGNAGTLCRAQNGSACDVADYCNGTTTTCADGKQLATYVCRAATNECDLDEKCDGTTDSCPSDSKVADNTACTDDGNVCTTDKCQSGVCVHAAGNAGTVCRASSGPCDLADTCSGSSSACPDAKQPATFVCRPATGECDLDERCDGSTDNCPTDVKTGANTACTDDGNPCTTDLCDGMNSSCQHNPGNAGTVCRAAAGPCDVDDKCSGLSATCTDAKQPNTFVCRPAVDVCDVDEKCDGSSNSCPTNEFKPSSFQCGAPSCAAGVATLATKCTGSAAACPATQTVNCPTGMCAGNVCQGCTSDSQCATTEFCASGVCLARKGNGESCSGTSECTTGNCVDGVCCDSPCNGGVCETCSKQGSVGTCSAAPANTVCRPAIGECDVEDTCGGSRTCPADANKDGQPCSSDGNACTTDVCTGAACTHNAAPSSTVCRPAAGECDVEETCGGATTCPQDAFKADGATCATDNNACTRDICRAGNCIHAPGNPGVVCRPQNGECDVEEKCDGTNAACPTDTYRANGTACSGDGNLCTSDICNAGTCTHPAGNKDTVCRAATSECKVDAKCDGMSTSCPSGDSKPDGTACTADTNVCTLDVCQSGICSHPVGNAGKVCRPISGQCDVAEKCDGTSPNCPNDAFKADNTACIEDGNLCTTDKCLAGVCKHISNDGATCNDGNACTSQDTCSASQCLGQAVPNCTCTTDAQCDDGNKCNGAETCVAGVCKPGTALSCDDGNSCTVDGCDPANGCAHVTLEDGALCNDGKYCTVNDACTAGTCTGQARDCSGSVTAACQKAGCDEANAKCGSVAAPDGDPCDDHDLCTTDDKCAAGKCAGTKKAGCSNCAITADCPAVVCTTALCNDMGTCDYVAVEGCDAGASGTDAGDASSPVDEGGGGEAGAPDASTPAPDGASMAPDAEPTPDGSSGIPGTGPDASESDDGGFFQTAPFGSCSCEAVGHRSSGTRYPFALSVLALGVLARRRRVRRPASM
jgi:hypothetical protein